METAVELTFPVQEAISSGYLVLGGNIFGAVFTVLFNDLQRKGGRMHTAFGYISLSVSLAIIFLVIFTISNPEFKRLNYEKYFLNVEESKSLVNDQIN